ncbi:unnamed protein product, partial [Prorocentrum cordatum]
MAAAGAANVAAAAGAADAGTGTGAAGAAQGLKSWGRLRSPAWLVGTLLFLIACCRIGEASHPGTELLDTCGEEWGFDAAVEEQTSTLGTVPPQKIDNVIGVVKAYTTRVGSGPFPTELQNEMQTLEDFAGEYIGPEVSLERRGHERGPYKLEKGQTVKIGEMLQEVGHEYGTTTGRRRRCGWLDIPLVKYSTLINGFDSLNITKLDVLTGLKQIRVAISYRNKQMTEVRLPRGYFPSHLEDLKEVVCEYETLEGWEQ